MNAFIKKYTPYFQFAAVVLTISLGAHQLLEKLTANTGPVVTIQEDTIHFIQKNENLWYLGYSVHLHREDCALSDKILQVEDQNGFDYDVFSTNYKLADTDQELSYSTKGILRKGKYDLYIMFYMEDDIRAKLQDQRVKFGGTFTHQCPEGIKLTVLPSNDKMWFDIK